MVLAAVVLLPLGLDARTTGDNPHGAIRFECSACHTPAGWKPLRVPLAFSHDDTGFPLDGTHRELACGTCHRDLDLEPPPVPRDCASCHLADFEATVEPDHREIGLPITCDACHGVRDWSPAPGFDHARTGFGLEGAHRTLDCAACHAGVTAGTLSDCFACHQTDFRGAADPNHVAAGFDTACESCHSASAWQPASFDHDRTAFPLHGAHRDLDCVACHADGFTGTPTDCFACHQADFRATVDPHHVDAGFPTDCASCHSTQGWSPAGFDHETTGFLLDGAHAPLECAACHAESFAGTVADCAACHQDDFQGTTDPDHAAAGFDLACESCHSTAGWEPATFDHTRTSFPLEGAHVPLGCAACHADGFAGTPTDCAGCHRDDYARTRDPAHAAAGFPTTCESCHTLQAWTPATFDHGETAFPLTGAHREADCASCHAGGFQGTPTDCFSCHVEDYEATLDPDHADAGFPTSCETCHTVQAWEPATFDHRLTDFPLDGGHASLDCAACHADGFAGTPSDCFSCHQPDYQATSDPDHADAGFPTTCETCHTVQSWTPSTFDHDLTAFPLRGGHAVSDCADCHAGGFVGTPTDCVACHQQDYDATDDPDHAAAGFPLTCHTCHDVFDWDDADWDHDGRYFPIFSGEHRGEWSACADCHTAPGNFRHFECIFCHEHSREEMADEHDDVGGYVWESRACLSCHPDGEE